MIGGMLVANGASQARVIAAVLLMAVPGRRGSRVAGLSPNFEAAVLDGRSTEQAPA
jgi:hypothetical protein